MVAGGEARVQRRPSREGGASRGSRARRLSYVPLVILTALSLAACGSSERTKLTKQLRSNLTQSASGGGVQLQNGSSLPVTPVLINCLTAQAGKLPLSQLRQVAGPNPPKSTSLTLISRCIAAGVEVGQIRTAIAGVVTAQIPQSFPSSYKSCITGAVSGLSRQQLAHLFVLASQNQAYEAQYGRNLALQCVDRHPNILRGVVVTSMRNVLSKSHLPAAFVRCMVGKVDQLPAAAIRNLVSGPNLTVNQQASTALGKRLGQQCVAQGSG